MNQAGWVVRQCFDVVLADQHGEYYCPDVPFPIGIKLKVGAMFNAPIEIGLDNDTNGGGV